MDSRSTQTLKGMLSFLPGLAGNFSVAEFLAQNSHMGWYYLACAGISIMTDAFVERIGQKAAAQEAAALVQDAWTKHGTLQNAINALAVEQDLHEIVSRDRAARLLRLLRASHDELNKLVEESIQTTAHVGRWLEIWCTETGTRIETLEAGVANCAAQLKEMNASIRAHLRDIEQVRHELQEKLDQQERRTGQLVQGVAYTSGFASALSETSPSIKELGTRLNRLLEEFEAAVPPDQLSPEIALTIRTAKAQAAYSRQDFELTLSLLPDSEIQASQQSIEFAVERQLQILRVRAHSAWHLRRFDQAAGHCNAILRLCPQDYVAVGLLASSLIPLGRAGEALEHLNALVDSLSSMQSDDCDVAYVLAAALGNRGNAKLELAKEIEAVSDYDDALQRFRDLAATGDQKALLQVGRVLAMRSIALETNDENALESAQEAVAVYELLRETSYAPHPEEVIEASCRLATLMDERSQFDDAEKVLERAATIGASVTKTYPQLIAIRAHVLMLRGVIQEQRLDAKLALEHYSTASDLLAKLVDSNELQFEPILAHALHFRAHTLEYLGQVDQALKYHALAEALCRKNINKNRVKMAHLLAELLKNRAITWIMVQHLNEAERDLDESIEICRNSRKPTDVHLRGVLAHALANQGVAHILKVEEALALRALSESIQIYRELPPSQLRNRECAMALLNRAALSQRSNAERLEDSRSAVGLYRQLVEEGRTDLNQELEVAEAALARRTRSAEVQ